MLLSFGLYTCFLRSRYRRDRVILRFGKFAAYADPGLHLKMPFGIDQVYLVPTGRVLKEEFGYRTVTPDVRTVYNKKGLEEESLTLTGDLNVSDVEWIVQFQIADPFKYVFRIKDPIGTIRDITEAMVRKAIGNANVSQVLTTERAALASQIELELQNALNSYDIGVRIVTVQVPGRQPAGPSQSGVSTRSTKRNSRRKA